MGVGLEVYVQIAQQRCWVHKTRNVLDKLPALLQDQAKRSLSLKMIEVICFKLIESTQKRLIRLKKGEIYMTDIIKGIKFKNGVIAENQNLDQNQVHQEIKCAA